MHTWTRSLRHLLTDTLAFIYLTQSLEKSRTHPGALHKAWAESNKRPVSSPFCNCAILSNCVCGDLPRLWAWPGDLLWLLEWIKNDSLPVLTLSLKCFSGSLHHESLSWVKVLENEKQEVQRPMFLASSVEVSPHPDIQLTPDSAIRPVKINRAFLQTFFKINHLNEKNSSTIW